jgi:hypothetical protein
MMGMNEPSHSARIGKFPTVEYLFRFQGNLHTIKSVMGVVHNKGLVL